VLEIIYLYNSNLVLGLNRAAREVIFNDRIILLKRKKLAVRFFCFSFIAIYTAFSSLNAFVDSKNEKKFRRISVENILYIAAQDYFNGRYDPALAMCRRVLGSEPGNIDALKRIAYIYEAQGNKKKAREAWKHLLKLAPSDKESKQNLLGLYK